MSATPLELDEAPYGEEAAEAGGALKKEPDARPALKPKKGHFLSAGIATPLCGFASGIFSGNTCVGIQEGFFWVNVPLFYHHRFNDLSWWSQ